MVHNQSTLYSKIKQIQVVAYECGLYYYTYWVDWLPSATL